MGQFGQLTVGLVVIAALTWIVAVVAFTASRGATGRVTRAVPADQPAGTAPWAGSLVVPPAREPESRRAAELMLARGLGWPGRGQRATTPASEAPEDRAEHADASTWRPLTEADRDRYEAAWRGVQAEFVDSPRAGIEDADRLVSNVLRARGYAAAVDDAGGQRSAVPHGAGLADAATRYAAAHDIAARRDDPNLAANELWQAMTDYQAAIDALLESATNADGSVPDRGTTTRSS